MTTTMAERKKRKRQKTPRKELNMVLSADASEKLARIQSRTGETDKQVVERLILGRGPSIQIEQ